MIPGSILCLRQLLCLKARLAILIVRTQHLSEDRNSSAGQTGSERICFRVPSDCIRPGLERISKMYWFHKALNEEVKQLLLSKPKPSNLENAINDAIEVDNRLFELRSTR